MAKRIDWEHGEKLWRLGQLSANQISKIIGCSTSTVIRHMEKHGVQRDHTEVVRQRTKEALTAKKKTQKIQKKQYAKRKIVEITEKDIEEAVDSNVALIMSHRKDLQRIAKIEQELLEELGDSPKKLYLSSYQGKIVDKEVDLAVSEKASSLLALANTQAKRIEKQRQAFNIDDDSENDKSKFSDLSTDELVAILNEKNA